MASERVTTRLPCVTELVPTRSIGTVDHFFGFVLHLLDYFFDLVLCVANLLFGLASLTIGLAFGFAKSVIGERPSVCMASSLSSGSAGGCGLEKAAFRNHCFARIPGIV